MVREHRLLTVKEGVNRIQFSWANTLIDPTSIDFRILDKQDKVDLVDTTFPSRPQRRPAMEHREPDGRQDPRRDPLLHQRHHLDGRLRGHRQRGRDEAEPDRLRAGVQQLGRTVRQRPDAAGRGHDQPGREDRRPGPPAAAAAARLCADRPRRRGPMRAASSKPPPSRRAAATPQAAGRRRRPPEKPKEVVKQGLSEYFLFTIEGREDIKDKEPKRLVALKVAEVPLECFYKLTDRDGGQLFTKFYRFKNLKLLDEKGKEKKLSAMENLGLSPLPDGMVRLFSEYAEQGPGLRRRHGDEVRADRRPRGGERRPRPGHHDPPPAEGPEDHQRRRPAVQAAARRHVRAVLRPDRLRRDVLLRGGDRLGQAGAWPRSELERRFDANVVLWGAGRAAQGLERRRAGGLRRSARSRRPVERVDQNHVKYFLDLKPGEKQFVQYSVTYKRRKVGPELNIEKKREPL